MGANTENKIWYLARNGKRHGPLSDLEMSKLVEMGHLKDHDLVWRPGFQEWRRSSSVFLPTVATSKPSKPEEGSTAQRKKISNREHNTSFKEKKDLSSSEQDPSPQAKKTPKLPEETFQWDIYYEGEDGPEFQYFKDNEDLRPEVSTKRNYRKVFKASAMIAFFGSIGTAGYYYYDQILLMSDLVITQLTKKEEPFTKYSSRDPQLYPQTSALGSSNTNIETKDLELQTNTRDNALQKSPMWALLKKEFPDWYKLQLSDIEKMEAENRSEVEINKKLTESLVALRRLNAQKALAASPDQLQKIASSFILNLSSLEERSVEDCYGFISNGELAPYAMSMTLNPTEGAKLHAQTEAIFRAIVEGEKSPSSHEQPLKGDYDLLAKELSYIGWSEADIQLFANPQILSNSPPAKVCKMVREWFSAHLSIKDEKVRDRLLFETLRPLVAG
ncbi:MAG: DUF4339 domain-containing protein [Hyphomicrobium sp.]